MKPFHSLSFTCDEKRVALALARAEKAAAKLGKKQKKTRHPKANFHHVR